MNNKNKYKNDRLKQLIDTDRIELAPEGFTSKIMSRIEVDVKLSGAAARKENISHVPVISVAVIVILIVTALFVPTGRNDSLSLPVLEFLKNVKVSLPSIDLNSIFSFNFPVTLVYAFVGILMLALFDIVLHGMLRR